MFYLRELCFPVVAVFVRCFGIQTFQLHRPTAQYNEIHYYKQLTTMTRLKNMT